MLGYFPAPHKDELLYSVIARCKRHHGITSDRQLVQEIFGSRDVAAVVDLPGHLKALEKNTFHLTKITAQQWLLNHTLFPAYQYFLPIARREKIITSLYDGRAWDVHTRIGHAAFHVKDHGFLRICKKCHSEQLEQFGEAFWRRLFQLNGSILCPIHQEYLYDTNVSFRAKSKYEFACATEAIAIKSVNKFYNDAERQMLIRLSENLADLLEVREDPIESLDQWTTYYSALADDGGHRLTKTRIDHHAVLADVQKCWSQKILQQLNVLPLPKSNWVVNIFRKHRKSFHYLHHLIIWLTFDACKPADIIRRVAFAYAQSAFSAAEISNGQTPSPLMTSHRRIWLSLLKTFPEAGVSWLRKYGSAGPAYAWLYRHDRLWLRQHVPKKVCAKREEALVDWNRRDDEYLNEYHRLHQSGVLVNSSGRISKAWLIKQIRQHQTLEKKNNKFPRTMSFISTLVETVENFQRRRLVEIITRLHEHDEKMDNWVLYRKAGIPKKYQTAELEKFIDDFRTDLIYGNTRVISQHT